MLPIILSAVYRNSRSSSSSGSLLEGTWCLDPDEVLSVGQDSEINRICEAYPYMRDDKFIAENLDRWLS